MKRILKPRRVVPFNTGTRTIWSKRDKANTRSALKSSLRRALADL